MPKSSKLTPEKQPPPPPDDYNDLISELQQRSGRSLQKTFIKKLWAVHQDIVAYVNPSQLRWMFFSPALLACPEGVKLVAAILVKIGVTTGYRLLEKLIMQFELSDGDCQRYGEVMTAAWKTAYQEGNFDLTEELETEVITPICQSAVYGHKPFCAKFRKVLVSFGTEKKLDKNVDSMITRILNGCLFRALGARNWIVQSSAAEVLYMFYPLVGDDAEDMAKSMETQHRHMVDLLQSDVISIRTDAAKNVLKLMGEYWLILPKNVIKEIFAFVIEELSRDTVVGVRVAVFEGLSEMAFVPACMNVFAHALKCVASRGIQDKSERVRLVAYQLLARLKNHKFISVFDIIDRKEAVAKMDLETVESCRRQLVPIVHILLPISSKDHDENYYRPRVNGMLKQSRLALLSYFRLLGPMKIIDASQAVKLMEMLLTWSYRYLRRWDKKAAQKAEEPMDEKSEEFMKTRAYLECALIIYMSCKGMLLQEANLKERCEKYFVKVVRLIYEKYSNTPILGTATAVCSAISKDELKPIAQDVLARLADDDVPVEAVEPFLETAIHFNPDSLFDSLENGLQVLEDLFKVPAKAKTKKRDVGVPEEVLATTLVRLKYLLQSYNMSSLVSMRETYRIRILKLLAKVEPVRDAIESRLAKGDGEEQPLTDKTLLTALEVRFILPLFAAVNTNDDDPDERQKAIDSTKDLLTWFEERIAVRMGDEQFMERHHEFFVQLTKTFLETMNVVMSAFDYTTRPLEYEDEADRPEESEKTKLENTSVAQIATRILVSMCTSSVPVELFVSILHVGATLCEESYTECHSDLASILRFVPKWINAQCKDDEEYELEKSKETLEALRQFQKKVLETDYWEQESAEKCASHFVLFSVQSLVEASLGAEYEDPRLEEYTLPTFISFGVNKLVLKDKAMAEDYLAVLEKDFMAEGCKFFRGLEDPEKINVLLERYTLLAQLLRILERNSKYGQQKIASALKEVTAKILELFTKDLETVENRVVNSLNAILDVPLPDGF
ncbi:unnamed protein product [Caenorhabditis sp. 36 PRJEB53466]|nr:unnamed protein product [Caenorhabditis sp. 36 PRJEB53466]